MQTLTDRHLTKLVKKQATTELQNKRGNLLLQLAYAKKNHPRMEKEHTELCNALSNKYRKTQKKLREEVAKVK